MLLSTKAIVLSKIRYKDSDLIIKCYTFEQGVKSYLLKNALKSKKGKFKPAYFQLLSLLEIEADYKANRTLHYFKDVRPLIPYKTLHTNVIKTSIVMFLAEILDGILQEEEKNTSLFNFIESALLWFDEADVNTSFHIIFLIELTKYLGFYPDISNKELPVFNLEEGVFQNKAYSVNYITKDKLLLFKKVLGIKFDVDKTLSFKANEKQELLNMILLYFKLHLDGFKQPKSLTILNQVFS
ncbi:DNA repair protein RecO [Pontimicrobium sp. IMCC45349]|uniref:DNA repair protein RecO n=1 Tax=Pontimicrobium sp. IMCC45349 TaxID=3391574 RepID=UPI0039A38459